MEGLVKIDNKFVIVIYKFISESMIRCIDLKGNEFYVNSKQLV